MGSHRHSGLLVRTHSAGTHKSRVPCCGAGPPVLTGPPAPASRSPMAHRSGSHHGQVGYGTGLGASRLGRCPPAASTGDRSGKPYQLVQSAPSTSTNVARPHCARTTHYKRCALSRSIPAEQRGRSPSAVSRHGLTVLACEPHFLKARIQHRRLRPRRTTTHKCPRGDRACRS
jgi:hypothetical protein